MNKINDTPVFITKEYSNEILEFHEKVRKISGGILLQVMAYSTKQRYSSFNKMKETSEEKIYIQEKIDESKKYIKKYNSEFMSKAKQYFGEDFGPWNDIENNFYEGLRQQLEIYMFIYKSDDYDNFKKYKNLNLDNKNSFHKVVDLYLENFFKLLYELGEKNQKNKINAAKFAQKAYKNKLNTFERLKYKYPNIDYKVIRKAIIAHSSSPDIFIDNEIKKNN